VAAEFGRFAAAVEWFTEYLLGDPRWTLGGVESLAEAAIGHWQEARLLADRHGVAAPHPAAVGSAAEFHAAMCVLRQWGAASAVAFTRPPAASEGSTEPSTVYAGLAPRCGGRLHCSADFARVRAGGETYRLTPNQRAVIGHMVRRTEAGQPDFSNGELLKECESQADHVRDVFRASGKTSLAWGRHIVSRRAAGRGWYGLALG
jgi:hypothetical protein